MADTRAPGAPDLDEPMAMRWTVGRFLAVAVFLAVVVFWAWILTGGPKKDNPDLLEDRAWVASAITRCDAMLDDLDAIPSAAEATSNVERAEQVRSANAAIAAMVDDLEASAPDEASDREVLEPWFADWRTLLSDRAAYADAVATDPGATFQVTENENLGRGVDDTIKTFADVNDMPECRPPGDVG